MATIAAGPNNWSSPAEAEGCATRNQYHVEKYGKIKPAMAAATLPIMARIIAPLPLP